MSRGNRITGIRNWLRSRKGRRILILAGLCFAVCAFFIWLGIGLYIYLPKGESENRIGMFFLYSVFPLAIIGLSSYRVYRIYKTEPGEPADEQKSLYLTEKDASK